MDPADYRATLSAEYSRRVPDMRIVVAFIFDEARNLLEHAEMKDNNFVLLRRAFTYFPRRPDYLTPLAVITDTTAKVSNFAPSRHLEASARATKMPSGTFPPFYLVANVDIWAPKNDDAASLAEMEDWNYYCRLGRPHWGALAKQIVNVTSAISINDIMELARVKLLGGREKLTDQGEPSIGEAMAVLGVRACVDVVPQCQLSNLLVAQHMRTLYFVSADRESMVTGYFSEPVLVQAAAQLTNETSSEVPSASNRWNMLLKVLLGSLKNGTVDAGFRGELVARVLLLLAWDKCCISMLRQNETILSTGIFLRAVLLVDFLGTLLNLESEIETNLNENFRGSNSKAWVRCSHFVKIDYSPTTDQLFQLFKRGAAAVTKELERGVDLVIPIVFADHYQSRIDKSAISCIFVQVKNPKNRDGAYTGSATTSLTDKAVGIKLDGRRPFLSLYMSFGPYIPRGKDKIVRLVNGVRSSQRVAAKARAEPSRQVSLAVFTLTMGAYKVLDESTANLLKMIGRNWINPIELHRENVQFCRMVSTMMPGQHAGQESSTLDSVSSDEDDELGPASDD